MSLPDQNKLADAIRRGRLTVDEEAQLQTYLRLHPEERTPWEEELNLNRALRQVADVPISSNFTRRVVEMATQDARPQTVGSKRSWSWLTNGWIPKLATTTAVAGLALLSYHQHQLTVRKEMAQTLATMAAAGNSLELLQNFDAIQRLGQVVQVPRNGDRDLIAALQ